MGWATPIYVDAQVEYRLSENCGCDPERDAQVEYRLAGRSDLTWIGEGLGELGLTAGTAVDPVAARALMNGVDWRTGEQLVRRKRELDPRGKLTGRVIVDAINAAAAAAGTTGAAYLGPGPLADRFARAERCVRRDGEAHLVPVVDVERLAAAAGLNAETLYGAEVVAEARRWQSHHVDVGVRGVDVVIDLPKSLSAAYGTAPQDVADAIEGLFMESVCEAVGGLEEWAAYGMTGHHGDGQRAERIETSGLLGWTTLHRSARPVDDSPGDPHLHAHVNIANLGRCVDGKWRSIASGGEDLHRYAHLINEIAEARLRAKMIDRFGARFARSETTGAWELVGVPVELRTAFSRRHQQVLDVAGEGATRDQQKTAARQSAEAKHDDEAAGPREDWRTRAAAVLGDEAAVDAMVAAALPGPDDDGPALSAGGGPVMPTPQQIAEAIWADPEHGLTASRKAVTQPRVLAAIAQTVPYLLSREQLLDLADEVLAVDGHAVRLPDSNRAHQLHRERYTHTSVVEAENTITECAAAGLRAGAAQLTEQAAELAISTAQVAQGFEFSAQQRAVVVRLLTAGHAVDAVIGVAGAGKTTLMAAARTGWEAAGLRVAGASTAAVAAANLAAEAGIESQTIAAWRYALNGGRGLDGIGVLVIDEAAMVDDRAYAALLRHAATTGTKVVGVGDPLQLRAVGIGGGFQRVHELVAGLVLDENRRQRDVVERAALQQWRDGARTTALSTLADYGHIHAEETSTAALTAMVAQWNGERRHWDGDPHGQVAELLLLAARRADIATLNAGARAVRVAAGELSGGRTFAVAGGERVEFAAGDIVHIRRNDYRSRRGQDVDVLNGFRGVVVALDDQRGVLVEWRRTSPGGGHRTEQAWMSAADIAEGRMTHGYAMTIGSAQGLTATRTLAYGLHADSHSLYPALSRAREASHLFLPLTDLEDHLTRTRLGVPRTDAELLDRAVAAYGRQVAADTDDVMVTDELTGRPRPARPPLPRAADVEAAPEAMAVPPAREPEYPAWTDRPYGSVLGTRLEHQHDEALERADQARSQAGRLQQRAADRAAELAGTPTPGQARAAAAAGVLEAAEQLAATAAHQAGVAAQQAAAARHARGVWEQVARSLTKGRLALRLAGTSRKETEAIVQQHQAVERDAAAAAHAAQSAARDAARRAWEQAAPLGDLVRLDTRSSAPRTPAELRQQLAAVREQLPAVAPRIDATIADDAAYLRRQAAEHLQRAGQHTAAAAGIQAEQALRADIAQRAPHQHARETQARAEAARLIAQPQPPRQEPRPAGYEPPAASRSASDPGR